MEAEYKSIEDINWYLGRVCGKEQCTSSLQDMGITVPNMDLATNTTHFYIERKCFIYIVFINIVARSVKVCSMKVIASINIVARSVKVCSMKVIAFINIVARSVKVCSMKVIASINIVARSVKVCSMKVIAFINIVARSVKVCG